MASVKIWGDAAKSIILTITGGAALATSAMAQQQSAPIVNPRGMLANFDVATIGPVLTELGIVWQQRQTPDGQTYIAANAGGSLSFNLVPTACLGPNNSNCVGVNTLALYSGGRANPQTVSAFSQRYVFISAGILPGNAGTYVSRYDIADYGIPRGNLASSLQSFVFLAERFAEELKTGTVTVSADGYADDFSARALNAKSAEGVGATAQIIQSVPGLHQAKFETTGELAKTLIASEGAAMNKISNVRK